MTETANFKLKKPGKTDPVDIDVLNENFDKIDEELGSVSAYVIDITSVLSVDFAETGAYIIDLTDTVDGAAILAAADSGSLLRLKFLNKDGNAVEVALDGRVDGSSFTHFMGIAGNPYYESYSQFELGIRTVDGAVTVKLDYYPNPMGAVTEAEEKPVHMDLSGYDDGLIVLEYADGGTMDVTVTFDDSGNPVSFSNGTDEFTITWPAEEAAESTEEETTTEETTEEGTS